jgi:cell division protein FtsL
LFGLFGLFDLLVCLFGLFGLFGLFVCLVLIGVFLVMLCTELRLLLKRPLQTGSMRKESDREQRRIEKNQKSLIAFETVGKSSNKNRKLKMFFHSFFSFSFLCLFSRAPTACIRPENLVQPLLRHRKSVLLPARTPRAA